MSVVGVKLRENGNLWALMVLRDGEEREGELIKSSKESGS
jgi:hypothetical protein